MLYLYIYTTPLYRCVYINIKLDTHIHTLYMSNHAIGLPFMIYFNGCVGYKMFNTAVEVFSRARPTIPKARLPEPFRRLRASNVIDGTDETEIQAATQDQSNEWDDNYKAAKFGDTG